MVAAAAAEEEAVRVDRALPALQVARLLGQVLHLGLAEAGAQVKRLAVAERVAALPERRLGFRPRLHRVRPQLDLPVKRPRRL